MDKVLTNRLRSQELITNRLDQQVLTNRLSHELLVEDVQVGCLRSALPGQGHAAVADLIAVCCQPLIHLQGCG